MRSSFGTSLVFAFCGSHTAKCREQKRTAPDTPAGDATSARAVRSRRWSASCRPVGVYTLGGCSAIQSINRLWTARRLVPGRAGAHLLVEGYRPGHVDPPRLPHSARAAFAQCRHHRGEARQARRLSFGQRPLEDHPTASGERAGRRRQGHDAHPSQGSRRCVHGARHQASVRSDSHRLRRLLRQHHASDAAGRVPG